MSRPVLMQASRIVFTHHEPGWDDIKVMSRPEIPAIDRQLWGKPPSTFHEFAETLQREITTMESRWLV